MEVPLNTAEILGAAARNNRRDGLTGVLAYADGIFIQVTEGPKTAVDALMKRLESDRRHRDIVVLGSENTRERRFPEWIMETPRMRPDHTALLHRLVGQCESSYREALDMMIELVREHEQRRA
tara:strand:- start:1676 stop:2044 length:369 start_codon:yes stop_codon:yes gene_type:complete